VGLDRYVWARSATAIPGCDQSQSSVPRTNEDRAPVAAKNASGVEVRFRADHTPVLAEGCLQRTMFEEWRNPEARARVDHVFHIPMLVLAFLILPLLALELFGNLSPIGEVLVEVGFWVIWLAFLAEFSIKISIAESKWQYVRRNWLDIMVILLPLLRPLRVLRITRGLQMGRSLRLLSLRAVGQKAITAIIFLIAHYRALGKGAGVRKVGGESTTVDQPELARLQEKVASLERRIASLEEEVAKLIGHGHNAAGDPGRHQPGEGKS